MKINWILALLKLCTFNAVEDDVSAIETEPDTTATEETPAEVESVADAAWDALQDTEADVDTDNPEPPAEEPATTEEKPAEAEKPAEEVKPEAKPDDITEEDLKPLESKNIATNERFKKITDGYSAEKARADSEKVRADTLEQTVTQQQESFESLRQLGFNDAEAANDLVEFSAFRHVLATGDAEKFKAIIDQQVQQFELMHGKKVSVGSNSLDAFPDLKAKVESLDLDEGLALEIAKGRKVQERITRESTQATQQTQTEQQHQEVINTAAQSVAALEANWKATDPDYQAILPELRPLMAELGQLPPAVWAKTIEVQYNALKRAKIASIPKQVTPVRANGHQTGKAVPASLQEAVLQEMDLI